MVEVMNASSIRGLLSRRVGVVLGVFIGVGVLGGCGNSMKMDPGAAAAPHNAADVAFTGRMIAHDQQAVAMAALVENRAGSTRVMDMAKRVQSTHGPQITNLRAVVAGWGPAASTVTGSHDMSGMSDDGGNSMGVLSPPELGALANTTATRFDRMFVVMMTTHHTGGMDMATTELAQGQDAATKELAASVRAAEAKELAELADILTSLPAS